MVSYRIGCGAGFAGDRTDAAVPVVRALVEAGGPACLMFETLAERTLADAQLRKAVGGIGYDERLQQRLAPILADCLENGIQITGNFGAADPAGAASAIGELASELGCRRPRIAVVTGDDILSGSSPEIGAVIARSLPEGAAPISANVYLGAGEIATAIADGADVVVTGRVADPALALGPLVAHFGWSLEDSDRVAAGTAIGHLLECGAQVTGGYFADPGFKDVPRLGDVGFPIAEVDEDGSVVITKPEGTGGIVSAATVKEQLLYEIHDPSAYLTPDVVLDLSDVTVEELGDDRVAVAGARGRGRPDRLKATVCHDGGFLGEAELSYAGPNAVARAVMARDAVAARLGGSSVRVRFDLIGALSVFAGDEGRAMSKACLVGTSDIRLRMAASGLDRRLVEDAVYEFGALYTCGPAGGAGLRMRVQRRLATASAFIPRELVTPKVRFVEDKA